MSLQTNDGKIIYFTLQLFFNIISFLVNAVHVTIIIYYTIMYFYDLQNNSYIVIIKNTNIICSFKYKLIH